MSDISRRAVLQAAGGALALAGSRRASAQAGGLQQLYKAAKKEGQLTWYSGVLDQPICVRVGQAFTEKYPGVTVEPDQDNVASRIPALGTGHQGRAGPVGRVHHDRRQPHGLS